MADLARTEATFQVRVEYFAKPDDPTLTEDHVWRALDAGIAARLTEFDIGDIEVRRTG